MMIGINLVQCQSKNLGDYKPVAMDESLRIVKNDSPTTRLLRSSSSSSNSESLATEDFSNVKPMLIDEPEATGNSLVDALREREDQSDKVPPSQMFKAIDVDDSSTSLTATPSFVRSMPVTNIVGEESPLVDIEDSAGKNISETLFAMPTIDTPTLTELITSKRRPTFVTEEPLRPVNVTSGKGDGETLAQYQIMIPILIPAFKKKDNDTDPQNYFPEPDPYGTGSRLEPNKSPSMLNTAQTISASRSPSYLPYSKGSDKIRYVKETHTEMVPIKKQAVKTVMRAERVPQKIITDYVMADGATVPSSVDDKLKPNEHLIKTVVTNYH